MIYKVKTYHNPLSVISLDSAKAHLGLDLEDESDDIQLTSLIGAAIRRVEGDTGRYLGPTVFTMNLDDFPSGDCIFFPIRPLTSVDSVQYYNESDVLTPLVKDTDYEEYDFSQEYEYGFIRPLDTLDWPTDVRDTHLRNVVIDFTGGFALNKVPEQLRLGALLVLAHLFDNRGNSSNDSLPYIYRQMIGEYKEYEFSS